ncbi:MAG: SufD family Fe-S cluster assembly protein [Planctomycetota bacterium]
MSTTLPSPPTTAAEAWRYVDTRALHDWQPHDASRADDLHALLQAHALDSLAKRAVVLHRGTVNVPQGLAAGISIDHRPHVAADHHAPWHDDYADSWLAAEATDTVTIRVSGSHDEALTLVRVLAGETDRARIHIDIAAGSVVDLRLITLHRTPTRAAASITADIGRDAVVRVDEYEAGIDSIDEVGINLVTKSLAADAGAHLRWTTALGGGVLQRHHTTATLLAANAEISLGGSTVVTGTRQAHHLIRVHHRAANARSRQTFKAIADDQARSSFDGIIRVDHGCDGTDALQTSNNLQLGRGARLAARPQLDIMTDEVVASHGATVGQPDQDEIRYLRSRGLSLRQAQKLIVAGFVHDGLSTMACPLLRARASADLLAQLET